MSWILSNNRVLKTVDTSKVEFYDKLKGFVENGVDLYEALSDKNNWQESNIFTSLASTLLGRYDTAYEYNLNDLLGDLKSLAEKTDYKNDGQVFWDLLDWDVLDSGGAIGPVGLQMNVDSGVGFEVLDENEINEIEKSFKQNFNPGDCISSLEISGRLGGKGSADTSRTSMSGKAINGSISFGGALARKLKVYSAYQENELSNPVNKAVFHSLKSIPNISDLGSVSMFLDSEDDGVGKIIGFEWLGGQNVETEGSLGASILTPAGGMLSVNIGGRISYGSGFGVSLEKDEDGHVLVSVKHNRESEKQGEFGVGYQIGISNFAPSEAAKILSHFQKADKVLEKLDSKINVAANGIETWLKPAGLVKTEIYEAVKKLLITSSKSGALDSAQAIESSKSIAGLFGYTDSSRLKENGTEAGIKENITELLLTLINDSQSLFTSDFDKQIDEISEKLRGIYSGEALSYLQNEVLWKVLPELDEKISSILAGVDASVLGEIKKVIGGVVDSVVDASKEYLMKVRKFLSDIAKVVEVYNTNLISINFSVWKKLERSNESSLRLKFDSNSDEAKIFYSRLIANPSRGIEYAASLASEQVGSINGVTVTGDWYRLRRLRSEKGHSLSLAIIDFSALNQDTLITDVAVFESPFGLGLSARSVFSKLFSFRNEKRYVSFINATNLWFSRDLSSDEDDIWPKSLPIFKLTYGQEEKGINKLTVGDVDLLFEEFVNNDVFSNNIRNKLLADLSKIKYESNSQSVPVKLDISVSIPSDRIPEFIDKASGNKAFTVDVTKRIIAFVEWNEILDRISKLSIYYPNDLRGNIPAILERALPGSSINTTNRVELAKISIENIRKILKRHKKIMNHQNLPMRQASLVRKHEAWLERLKDATTGIYNALKSGNDILNLTEKEVDIDRIQNLNEEISMYIEPFMVRGVPSLEKVPKWLGIYGLTPKRIISFFLIVEELCDYLLEVEPVINVTLSSQDGRRWQYINSEA